MSVTVRLEDIHKRFGPVRALAGARLDLRPGEVHAVLGENGAGKTTLLRVLGGLQAPDEGAVLMGGSRIRLRSPRDAWAAGIGLVHQHFTLVANLTVLENLALGVRSAAPRALAGFALPMRAVRARATALSAATGLTVPLDARVATLGVGERQRVEILKVLLREPRVLALDEPTAVLAPAEVEALLELLRAQARQGRSVLLVAHKLDEVLAVADRITVLRAGRTVLEAPRAEVDALGLARAMVGDAGADQLGEVLTRAAAGSASPPVRRPAAAATVRLEGVVVHGARGAPAVLEVDLEVHPGDIVGIAGVEGNGQRELARVLARRLAPDGGRAVLPDDPGFIPQDRTHEGLVLDFDVAENLALALHRRRDWKHGPLLRWGAVRSAAADLIARYQVRASGPAALARTLSGGNQQRLVVGRELESGRGLLVAENPTRGLDVAATAFVHGELLRLRAEGETAIVLLSTDLDEVLALSDRVLVMLRGRLTPVPDAERTRVGIGRRMLSADDAGIAHG